MNPEDTPEYKAGQKARRELKDEEVCPYSMPRVAVASLESEAGYKQSIISYHLWKAGYNDEDMEETR